MRRLLLAVALLPALGVPAQAGVISGYDPASPASHQTYDRFASGFPAAPVANSSSAFVAAGIDLSGVGWLASDPKFAVTLISPRHIVGAAHVGFPGNQVQFVNAAGAVKTYTVTSSAPIGSSDLLLGTLSESPLPTSEGMRYFGVADVTAAQAVGLPILVYGQNPTYTNPVTNSNSPHLGTNVIDDVILANTTRTIRYFYTDGVPGEMYLIGGDSGGPVFVRAHGDLALVGVNYAVSDNPAPPNPGSFSVSTFVPEYVGGLNAAMLGTGFQVTVVPVPEPAGLLAVALGAAVGMARRVSRRRPRSGCPAPR